MFPGYVTIFKDNEQFIHLYFYPGIDENDNFYYRDLDLSNCNINFTKNVNNDGSTEYVFENQKILKIVCKLIDNNGNLHVKELKI